MTDDDVNVFHITGYSRADLEWGAPDVWEESNSHWWIPHIVPFMQSFYVFFELGLNKLLNK